MDATDRYWNLFCQIHAKKIFINKVLIRNRLIDKWLNSILAIASSSAIASWAFYQNYPLFWSAVIVISQVITALKPILPLNNNIESLENIKLSISLLQLEMENKWFLIENSMLEFKEINDLVISFQKEILTLEDLHLKKVDLEGYKKLKEETIIETEQYYKLMFGVK